MKEGHGEEEGNYSNHKYEEEKHTQRLSKRNCLETKQHHMEAAELFQLLSPKQEQQRKD